MLHLQLFCSNIQIHIFKFIYTDEVSLLGQKISEFASSWADLSVNKIYRAGRRWWRRRRRRRRWRRGRSEGKEETEKKSKEERRYKDSDGPSHRPYQGNLRQWSFSDGAGVRISHAARLVNFDLLKTINEVPVIQSFVDMATDSGREKSEWHPLGGNLERPPTGSRSTSTSAQTRTIIHQTRNEHDRNMVRDKYYIKNRGSKFLAHCISSSDLQILAKNVSLRTL